MDDFDDAVGRRDPIKDLEPITLDYLGANTADARDLGGLGMPADEFNRCINCRKNVDGTLRAAFDQILTNRSRSRVARGP